METKIRNATAGDLPLIEQLLNDSGLPVAGVADHLGGFVVAEHDAAIVASAGIEWYGEGALLRSVAVRPEFQGRGLARDLVDGLLARARSGGVHRVFLLTSTAAEYFRRVGFKPIPDDEVDPGVRASQEFGDCCCTGAQAMRLTMGGDQ